MSTNSNSTASKNFFRSCSQQGKLEPSTRIQQPSSETSKQYNCNNSYYETSKQQYKTKVRKENMSDLSVLIYEGLQAAKKEVYQNQFITKMEQTYKKQLQLEYQLCKQLQGLTMMSILRDKQCQILEKQSNVEVQIGNLKEQLYEIEKKLQEKNLELNIAQEKTCEYHKKPQGFNIVRKMNSKGKLEKFPNNDIQQNTYQTIYQQNSIQNESKQVIINKFYQSQNLSTINSRGSSFLTHQLVGTTSPSPTRTSQKKVLLFKRMNLMKEEMKLTQRNFQQKAQLIKSEISLLKKQLSIINENIQKDEAQEYRKVSLTPFQANTGSIMKEKCRNPRFTSQCSKKSDKKQAFKSQKKMGRPSMFHDKKIKHFSPTIYRCGSENKIYHKVMIQPQRLNSEDQKKLSQIRSSMIEDANSADYLYFTNRKHERIGQKKYGTNRRKNAYYD